MQERGTLKAGCSIHNRQKERPFGWGVNRLVTSACERKDRAVNFRVEPLHG